MGIHGHKGEWQVKTETFQLDFEINGDLGTLARVVWLGGDGEVVEWERAAET
jgi:hypothetical protein